VSDEGFDVFFNVSFSRFNQGKIDFGIGVTEVSQDGAHFFGGLRHWSHSRFLSEAFLIPFVHLVFEFKDQALGDFAADAWTLSDDFLVLVNDGFGQILSFEVTG
jgi:hypothetical protein